MAAHGICFDFYYRPKPSQIGQNDSAAAADARLAGPRQGKTKNNNYSIRGCNEADFANSKVQYTTR